MTPERVPEWPKKTAAYECEVNSSISLVCVASKLLKKLNIEGWKSNSWNTFKDQFVSVKTLAQQKLFALRMNDTWKRDNER